MRELLITPGRVYRVVLFEESDTGLALVQCTRVVEGETNVAKKELARISLSYVPVVGHAIVCHDICDI